jgi:Flp pilus assembly protein protease CpaA
MFDALINLFGSLIGADSFLFWVFLVGILVATCQDLKRREVDNWLNFFLFVFGAVFVFYSALFMKDVGILFNFVLASGVLFAVMNIFYYGRVFAGGDAKLLFAMSALFVASSFYFTLINIGLFLFSLMFCGSVYGLSYSLFLYFRSFKKVNKEMGLVIRKFNFRYLVFVFIGCFFVLGFLSPIFFLFCFFSILFFFLFVFSKALEKIFMIREVSGFELREGDWLVDDVRVGQNIIRANWEGLSSDDVKVLRRRKKIKIKDGLPFVPAFLFAFLAYFLLRDWILGFLSGLF